MRADKVWQVIRSSAVQWSQDEIPRRSAALAFYAGFSIAPLLLIAIAIAGLAFGADAVEGRVVDQLRGLLGTDAARTLETILKNTRTTKANIVATGIGFATLLVGASGVFGELQTTLNGVWKVKRKPRRGIRGLIRDRLLSFGFVLGFGFLLLASLLVSAALSAVTGYLGGWVTGPGTLRALGLLLSFAVTGTMFAMMFKILPDVRTRWRDVWLGAMITSLLFTLGKGLIGLYLGRSAFASSYGAAGSFVLLLMWLYYCGQVVLFGAEITHAYAHAFGQVPVPKSDAISLEGSDPSEPSSCPDREDRSNA
jgi:membrane protein